MKAAGVLVSLVVVLGLTGCAKPPTNEMDAARNAVGALASNDDVSTYAPEALAAAKAALAAMDEELAAQAKRSSTSRRYDTVKALAVEARRLAEKAIDDARLGSGQASERSADLARVIEVIERTGAEGAMPAGEVFVVEVKGGKLEYLASSAGEGLLAIFDGGYPDTGVGEGYKPRERTTIVDTVSMTVAETIEGSRDDTLQALTDRGYGQETGDLGFGTLRFVSRVREESADANAIDLFVVDDAIGLGALLYSFSVPAAVPGGAVSLREAFGVTPDGSTIVVFVHRSPTNEHDPGEDTAVVFGRDTLGRFMDSVAQERYKAAAARAASNDATGALEHLWFLKDLDTTRSEELLSLLRSDKHYDNIRSDGNFAALMRTVYPKRSRAGLDELFEEHACRLVQERLKGALDARSVQHYADFRTRIAEGSRQPANFAGQCVVVEWGCGSGCQTGAILDLQNGKIYDLPSAQLGYEYRTTSLLLVVNPPSPSAEENEWPGRAFPSYHVWAASGLEPLHDTGARGK